MIDRTTKLRWRRRIRRQQRQVEEAGAYAEAGLEQHFFRRLSRLTRVRRFVVSWLLLLVLVTWGSVVQLRGLSTYYQMPAPAPGGTFTEGVVGTFTNANPLYATTAADSTAAELVFSSLMQYNEKNELVGDLAEDVAVDRRGVIYTVTLRDNVYWHDGEQLRADDVVFTYRTIQNPDARSPLFSSWRGVRVEAKDDRTVVFTLPNALTAFPHSLKNGIVPKHLLEDVAPDQLRAARFNTVSPIGSGPFKWEQLEVVGSRQETREERIGFEPNERYYKETPKLQRFILRTFREEKLMLDAFERGRLNAMVGLAHVPEQYENSAGFREFNIPLAGEVMVFFKASEAPLNNVDVRRALVQAVHVPDALEALGYPVVRANGPLLNSQSGYDPNLTQLPFDRAKARERLEAAGWRMTDEGVRQNAEGQELTFSLSAQDTKDYRAITEFLQKSWQEIGVKADINLLTDSEIQGVVQRHGYQALLYGISVGPDPDVFAYWHSSQADPRSARLNLSEYSSEKADTALEEGRIRSIPAARIARYKSFLEAWRSDAPALALYQPRFLYITRGDVFNFEPQFLNSPSDRFANVHNWMIREEKIIKQQAEDSNQ